jgi:restriction endonuclease S subunit
VGQQRVDREVIFNTLIPVPPKFEQNKIVQNVIRFMDYIEMIEAALI